MAIEKIKILGAVLKLKPGQNKKGQKILQLHHFFEYFSQLPAVKKYSKNGAAGKFFGPPYFVTALGQIYYFSITSLLLIKYRTSLPRRTARVWLSKSGGLSPRTLSTSTCHFWISASK